MLKLVTWNVNSIKARLERVVDYLKRTQPDICCFQELKGTTESFPFQAIEEMGYQTAVYGQKTYNGVAILAKTPLKNIECGFGDNEKEDEQARLIRAKIGKLTVLCTYFPNGQEVGSEKYNYKLIWMERLRKTLENSFQPSELLTLVGDFNVIPEDRDVYDPEAWRGKILFSEPEKSALEKIRQFGLHDTLRLHHPDPGLYSWWDYRQLGFQKNRGLRIDFILATKPLADRCQKAYIDREERKGPKPSDHAPVVAEFDL